MRLIFCLATRPAATMPICELPFATWVSQKLSEAVHSKYRDPVCRGAWQHQLHRTTFDRTKLQLRA